MPDDLPPSLVDRHPELAVIANAIEQHCHGHPITAACPTCGGVLAVIEVAVVGVLVVTCPGGHIRFRARRGSP